jgi:multiple sugar transport system ATP-binding protein
LPAGKAQALIEKDYIGKVIILGIRPEDIKESEMFLEAFPKSVIEAKVNVTELLGSEAILYLSILENEITAKVDSRSFIRPGDKIKIAFDLNKIHIFDKDTELTITN